MDKPQADKIIVGVDSLKRIALFLEGYKLGNGGHIRPLGTNDLEQLWNAIGFLQGDVRYKLKGDGL
jgi:hypothetical protein